MCLPKSLKQSIQLGAELHGMLGFWDAGSWELGAKFHRMLGAGILGAELHRMLGAELLGMLQCWKLEWPPPGCGGGETGA